MITFKIFENSKIIYGLSQKADGNMHLAFSGNQENRNKFFRQQNIINKNIFAADLVHGTTVQKIYNDDNRIVKQTDGLVAPNTNSILSITVADCFPVYFFDRIQSIVGLAHCGWRGIMGNLADKTISAMESNPADVLVGIGPGIQACHFEIKNDILNSFKNYPEAIIYREGKIFIDLPAVIIKQLTETGVKRTENLGECTYCNSQKYYSYRRDKPKNIEAMLAYIGLLN